MQEQLDLLIKTVKDAADAIRSARATDEENIKALVAKTLKDVLGSHPGITAVRKVQFDGAMPLGQEEILNALPKEVQQAADDMYLLSAITKQPVKSLKRYKAFRGLFEAKGGEFAKALDSTNAGGGDEWVPTGFSPNLIDKVRLQLKVAALFPVISMPTNPYVPPVQVGDFSTFLQPENTGDTGQTIIPVGDTVNVTGNFTLTAKGHSSRVLMSKEVTEDSIIPMLPFVRTNLIRAMAQGREDIIINGDDSGSHLDSDTAGGSAQLRRKLTKGLRALTYLNSYTADLSTLSVNNLLDLIGLMGVYGVNPGDTAFVTGINGMIALMKMDLVQTLDKIGPNAVVLQGQMGTVLGRSLIVSEYMRQDLASTGIYGSGQSKTSIILVNRNGLAIGETGTPTSQLLTELYAVYNQNALLTTERIDFQSIFPIASNKVAYNGINVG